MQATAIHSLGRTSGLVRKSGVSFLLIVLVLIIGARSLQAETANVAEMEQVCRNFIAQTTYQKGSWNGDPSPVITRSDEILDGSRLLARYYTISSGGFVLVPTLKEMTPVKAYSEISVLDDLQEGGFLALVRETLAKRYDLYERINGSLDAPQPSSGDVLFARGHRKTWDLMALPDDQFIQELSGTAKAPASQGGPLLTTSWHQHEPYNNLCPMGDGDRCVVGCVATATAQILRYWNWPPEGIGEHTYYWDGDDSCDDPSPTGDQLSADYMDTYDWPNMPESCDVSCNTAEEDALAELCYEVGIAFDMDYGACGSGTNTSKALQVFPDYFKFSRWIGRADRIDTDQTTWYNLIRNEIDLSRPIQYRISSHSIVCDGYRDDGGQFEYHMNYGWGGPFTAWFVFDSLYCYWEPDSLCPFEEEYLILQIHPLATGIPVVDPMRIGDGAYIGQGETVSIELTIANAGYVDLQVLDMGTIETDGPPGWLDLTYSGPFTVGTNMTDTVRIPVTINPTGYSDPGNVTGFVGGIYIVFGNAESDSGTIPVEYYMADEFVAEDWDTVSTLEPWAVKSPADAGDHIALVVSNYGSFGKRGSGGVNMDFTVAGGECDPAASVYLYDGSMFVMQDRGDSVYGSIGIYRDISSGPEKFRPVNTGFLSSSGSTAEYDSMYTGGFANWDTSVVMERTYYAPRNLAATPSFVVARTLVYAGKEETVDHLTFGSIIDWDIPSEYPAQNTSGVNISGNYPFVYMQGYDDIGVGCQDNLNRFGTEAILGWRNPSMGSGLSPSEYNGRSAERATWFSFGDEVVFSRLLDTVSANQDALVADDMLSDQVIVNAWQTDQTLYPGDTLEYFTILATVHDGAPSDLVAIVYSAAAWCYDLFDISCCIGAVGSIALDRPPAGCPALLDPTVDISDLTDLISHLFISFEPLCCVDEADISPLIAGGSPDGTVDVGDLTALIDHLFISFPALPACP
ncbi:MAG: C10 family peptidase [candidate division Zixibacteria bacterium]|nr:C10 family peptidase [candidate division Zixibacteria bacterium]